MYMQLYPGDTHVHTHRCIHIYYLTVLQKLIYLPRLSQSSPHTNLSTPPHKILPVLRGTLQGRHLYEGFP